MSYAHAILVFDPQDRYTLFYKNIFIRTLALKVDGKKLRTNKEQAGAVLIKLVKLYSVFQKPFKHPNHQCVKGRKCIKIFARFYRSIRRYIFRLQLMLLKLIPVS